MPGRRLLAIVLHRAARCRRRCGAHSPRDRQAQARTDDGLRPVRADTLETREARARSSGSSPGPLSDTATSTRPSALPTEIDARRQARSGSRCEPGWTRPRAARPRCRTQATTYPRRPRLRRSSSPDPAAFSAPAADTSAPLHAIRRSCPATTRQRLGLVGVRQRQQLFRQATRAPQLADDGPQAFLRARGSRSRSAYCAWVNMIASGVRNWCEASARNCDCSSSTRR